jgi:hypothetical protein
VTQVQFLGATVRFYARAGAVDLVGEAWGITRDEVQKLPRQGTEARPASAARRGGGAPCWAGLWQEFPDLSFHVQTRRIQQWHIHPTGLPQQQGQFCAPQDQSFNPAPL